MTPRTESYRSWLIGELGLIAVLGAATVLFVATSELEAYSLPEVRLALDTAVSVMAGIVAILTAIRFLVDGRAMDLLLAAGFMAACLGTFLFSVAPRFGGDQVRSTEGWTAVAAQLISAALIAAAPFLRSRLRDRRREVVFTCVGVVGLLAASWVAVDTLTGTATEVQSGERGFTAVMAFALLAVLALVAAIGFGLRYRSFSRDLDSWLALGLTLVVFADLHYVLVPVLSSEDVVQGDFLRLLAYGVLLLGVWRAISEAEFGRAVGEERARVAREIHDGLAQYLFALSTTVSMLEHGASLEQSLPRLKEASAAAQQEARFAVLALSSASGSAPFDAALARYVDFLSADGELDVELDIDARVMLAPDEQIEIFRIVQEGLANARKHAGARHAWVSIQQRGPRRVVTVRDDGTGFDGEEVGAGQGLRNMRLRAASIEGGFSLSSTPGRGTAIEVVLRAV
ncbi:MAG TPA: histidine kinase [Gaiellaceae bacterium]|jgi:signal transduction histidine kinase|nr:histidine kinase [Gaiellaceae bacterium]